MIGFSLVNADKSTVVITDEVNKISESNSKKNITDNIINFLPTDLFGKDKPCNTYAIGINAAEQYSIFDQKTASCVVGDARNRIIEVHHRLIPKTATFRYLTEDIFGERK